MSKIEVDAIEPQSGTTLTIGASGDSVNIASGATITDFTSTGIDDNATSTAITIDSSENIGIGTVSPADTLNIGVGTKFRATHSASVYQQIYSTASGNFIKAFGDNLAIDSVAGALYLSTLASQPMVFQTNNTEAMRINSGGAMLLGTITAGSASAGDLVVNGGVFLGGTATANELDDYEEGTFTPIYRTTGNQLSSVTYNAWTGGTYTKVGQLVTVTGAIASNAVTQGSPSGNLRIGGLPFTVRTQGSTLGTRGTVAMSNQNLWATNNTPNNGYVVEGTTEFDLKILYGNNDDAAAVASTDILAGSNTGANRLFFSIIYVTDA
jgi:hypothetical protein